MSPEGRRLLAERRWRLRRMRRRVVATSFATFAVAWAVIFFQMVSGHDPALTRNGQAHAKVAAKTSTHKSTSSSQSSSSSDGTSSDDSSSSAVPQTQTQVQTPAPVTTSQS